MIKSYKYCLNLTGKQKTFFLKSFGCSRYIYNWALDKKIKAYQLSKTQISAFDLIREITPLKKELVWLKEVSTSSLQSSVRNLESAFSGFLREKKGFPNFKAKYGKQSCKFTQHVQVNFKENKIRIPKVGWVNAFIDREFQGKIGTSTVSKNASGKYFISICVDDGVDLPIKKKIKEKTTIGVDVGLKTFATLSDGTEIENPKYLENGTKRLAILQRRLSKKQKGSKRREKAKLRVAKMHCRIACQRNDFLHKTSTSIVKNHDSIIVETLNVQGMMQNHSLARSISSVSWGEFFRQLEYKCNWYGKNLIKIGRFEPSSKMCSCGVINKELKLSDREWTCSSCGVTHDRDLLAAQNIKRFGLKSKIRNSGGSTSVVDVEMLPIGKSVKRQVKIKLNNIL